MKAKLPGVQENHDVALGSPRLLEEQMTLQECTELIENWGSMGVPGSWKK